MRVWFIWDIKNTIFFLKVFVGPKPILWGHWYPLLQTLDDSAHEFQIQGGSIIACALLSLACNVPQSHLWLLRLGIEPGSLAPEATMIPLRQPNPAKNTIFIPTLYYYDMYISAHKCT